jgi:hypothetical protein
MATFRGASDRNNEPYRSTFQCKQKHSTQQPAQFRVSTIVVYVTIPQQLLREQQWLQLHYRKLLYKLTSTSH